MSTYTQPLSVPLGTGYTGLAGTGLGYTVKDAAGNTQIARTTTGIVELNDADGAPAGVYEASATFNSAWFPARVYWDATGVAGLLATEVIGSDEGADNAGSAETIWAELNAQAMATVTPLAPFGVGSPFLVYYRGVSYPVYLGVSQSLPLSIRTQLTAQGLL